MAAYYNEIEPAAAAWLRELIKAGHIAPGEVDERSIVDVRPSDLAGFDQCHFFAGIGVWSYSLRLAGWPDDRPVWTGSCPCQPFSAAGKGGGFDDERHLWPAFFHLIGECGPAVVFGEQVASKDADPWIDLVQTDMEALGYAFGAVPFPSAGVGAPHIRDRTYWLANAASGGRREFGRSLGAGQIRHADGSGDASGGLADSDSQRFDGQQIRIQPGQPREADAEASGRRGFGGLADTYGGDASAERQQRSREQRQQSQDGGIGHNSGPGPTNGLWRDADWLACRDGKWRPVEPGTFPLVASAAKGMGRGSDPSAPIGPVSAEARTMRLRGYGNAINAEAAAAFIESYLEAADAVL